MLRAPGAPAGHSPLPLLPNNRNMLGRACPSPWHWTETPAGAGLLALARSMLVGKAGRGPHFWGLECQAQGKWSPGDAAPEPALGNSRSLWLLGECAGGTQGAPTLPGPSPLWGVPSGISNHRSYFWTPGLCGSRTGQGMNGTIMSRASGGPGPRGARLEAEQLIRRRIRWCLGSAAIRNSGRLKY